jgi:hypothetical protein
MEAKAKLIAAALNIAADHERETYENPSMGSDAQAELDAEIFDRAVDEYVAIKAVEK